MRCLYHCVLQSVIFHAMTPDLRFWSAKFCTAPYPGVILANQIAAYRTHDYVSVGSCFDVYPSCLMDLYSYSRLSESLGVPGQSTEFVEKLLSSLCILLIWPVFFKHQHFWSVWMIFQRSVLVDDREQVFFITTREIRYLYSTCKKTASP